ncbi:MAG TPA: hypothetical protein VMY99_00265 [Nevskiaceae bacterium]|nr:hypothetical protein [Nevskiaceae bacterium]
MKKWSKKAASSPQEQKVVTGDNLAPQLSLWKRFVRNKRAVIAALVVVIIAGVGVASYVYYQSLDEEGPAIPKTDIQTEINRSKSVTLPANATPEQKAGQASSLGILYLTADDASQAIPYLLQAESQFTSDADKYGTWLDLASAYEKIGDKQNARTYYQKALDFAKNASESNTKLISQLEQKIKSLGG